MFLKLMSTLLKNSFIALYREAPSGARLARPYWPYCKNCPKTASWKNDHITVHFTDVEFYTVKNNTFQHWKHKPKWIINLFLDSPELENSFWIIANPNKHFASSPFRLFQFYQLRLFLSFLCLWTNRFAILVQYLSNLELDFIALLFPRPIMRIWNLN